MKAIVPSILCGLRSALLAPFSSAVVHPVQLRSMLGQRAQAVGVAIGLASLAAHAWFWWCAWRGRRNRAAFVATALMLLFYGLVAGILVVRVSTHALAYLWQPRYVVIYQWSILALLMMGISQLGEADEAPAARRRTWPAATLACVAIALLALQVPLSQHSWSGVRYRNAAGEIVDIETDFVFMATGERPDMKMYDALGLDVDDKGFVIADRTMLTSVPSVYAVGDLLGPPMEMFKARKCGVNAAKNIMGEHREYDYTDYPDFFHTTYEVTWVGLRGTGVPEGFTVTVAFIPGWTLQISWNMPTLGKV